MRCTKDAMHAKPFEKNWSDAIRSENWETMADEYRKDMAKRGGNRHSEKVELSSSVGFNATDELHE